MLWCTFTPCLMRVVYNGFVLASFMLLGVVAQAALNDTGISTCSNKTQNGLPCPVEGFPGQDAEYGINSFNFTKFDASGNAMSVATTNHVCVQDNVTGLMWEVKTDDGGLRDKDWSYTWYDSNSPDDNPGTSSDGSCSTIGRCDTEKFVQDVNATNLCGHNDWRVPNPHELASIVDYSIGYPVPTIDSNFFSNTSDSYFWTASAYAGDSSYSWVVYFYYGSVYSYGRYGAGAVRLVRGGQWFLPYTFINKGDGTVTDQITGLMWAKCSVGQGTTDCSGSASSLTWQQALQAADSSTLAGYSDWRLPNVKELQTLIDYTKYDPSINTSVFVNTPSMRYWSASAYAFDSSYSWVVFFSYGFIYSNHRYGTGAVRLVRDG